MKRKNKIKDFISGGIALGIGAEAVSTMNSDVSNNVGQGLSNIASYYPVTGSTIGAGLALESFNYLDKGKKRRGRKNDNST